MNTVKVTKDGITKTIQKKDLSQYLAMGWKEVKEIPATQQYDFKKFTRVI